MDLDEGLAAKDSKSRDKARAPKRWLDDGTGKGVQENDRQQQAGGEQKSASNDRAGGEQMEDGAASPGQTAALPEHADAVAPPSPRAGDSDEEQ